jgi:hemoglobin-like flavoprotein
MSLDDPALSASLARIRANIDRFATTFYNALYLRAPALRRLFENPAQERRKLGAMLATLGNLRHWEKIEPVLHKLGERHVDYGVQREDYPLLVDAFLDGVREIDGEYAPQSCLAWQTLFSMVIAAMTARLAGARPAAANALQQAARDARLLEGAASPRLPPGCETLYAEVGGLDAILRVHRRFYATIFADDWLGGFFATKSQESLVLKQSLFMAAAFGGPDDYRWETPAIAHMHMYVTAEQADIRETLLRNALRAEGFSASVEERWLATDQAFRPAIVKASVQECVTPHPGQMPVAVKKPVGYKPPRLLPREALADA